MILILLGEHTQEAYACVNFIPSRANLSMFGVWYVSLKAVFVE
jgi:hypothetical protein